MSTTPPSATTHSAENLRPKTGSIRRQDSPQDDDPEQQRNPRQVVTSILDRRVAHDARVREGAEDIRREHPGSAQAVPEHCDPGDSRQSRTKARKGLAGQVAEYPDCEGDRRRPTGGGTKGHGEGGGHDPSDAGPLQGAVQGQQRQEHEHLAGDVGTLAVDNQGLETAGAPQSARIDADGGEEQQRWRKERVHQSRNQGSPALEAKGESQAEQGYRAQRVRDGRYEVISMCGGPVTQDGDGRDGVMQRRLIDHRPRHSFVPEWKPRVGGPISRDVAGHRNEGSLDRAEVNQVLGAEKPRADIGVQREEEDSRSRVARAQWIVRVLRFM